MRGLSRAMGPSFAASAHRARRAFASGQEEEAEAEKGSKWDSQGMHLEGGANAYQVLGVSPSCSPYCIREAFTKLAKLTHPDLQPGTSTSAQFILVLSAYQILSSPARRAQYDVYLQKCANSTEKICIQKVVKRKEVNQDMNVVEWLQWYRNMAMTLVHQHEIGTGRGYYDEFRANVHEAMKRAYFGPHLGGDDCALPDCFEAEERADATELEVLHLVSGRKLIGAVLQVDPTGLLEEGVSKLAPFAHSKVSQITSPSFRKDVHTLCFDELLESRKQMALQPRRAQNHDQSAFDGSAQNHDHSAFVDLELYLYGNLVARATRAVTHDNSLDEIMVYLCHDPFSRDQSGRVKEDVFLGTILGLNTTESGGKGRVYSTAGEETHIIWQFRTPWVKHMNWFKIDSKRMLCECRSTRARLPSSKFWLFEPRCGTHDIGGWYIETLWRNGSTEAGTSTNWAGKRLGLLHPAMYILGTAYKTLDSEVIKRSKKSYWSTMWDQPRLFTAAAAVRALRWCKLKLFAFKQ